MATEGWIWDLSEVEEREVMKSVMMAFWVGLKLPYQIRLTEMSPVRRAPLWYCMRGNESWTNSVSRLVANEKLKTDNKNRRVRRRGAPEAIVIEEGIGSMNS